MKLAIMQPYFFPYIGYFQLIQSVDKMVLYDDVNYINRGWINRNNILNRPQKTFISVPLVGASQNKLINEIDICRSEKWESKLLNKVHHSYSKAPFYAEIYPIIESIVLFQETNLAAFLYNSIKTISSILELNTSFEKTSTVYNNSILKAQYRILDICKKENSSDYYNAIGGKELYSSDMFSEHGINIKFIKPRPVSYSQFGSEFEPNLSIIDVLMFNSIYDVRQLLTEYDCV